MTTWKEAHPGSSENPDEAYDRLHGLDGHVQAGLTYNEVRLACVCGRFLAESAIRETDRLDPSAYYGISTDVEWDCSRCGTVTDEVMPQIVVVGTRVIPPAKSEPVTHRYTRATGAIVPERQRCICGDICLDHCRACNHSGRDLEEPCIADPDWEPDGDGCPGLCGEHHWLDRPESDTRECLICGEEANG